MFNNDPLGDICTEEEVKFLSEVLFEAWFALDVRNMSTKKSVLTIKMEMSLLM